MFHKLHVLGMNGDLWHKVRGLGSETWRGCKIELSHSIARFANVAFPRRYLVFA